MNRLAIIAAALVVAGCSGVTISPPAITAPDIRSAPFPAAPAIAARPVNGLVCITPEGALDVAEYLTATIPGWAAGETARAEFYRRLVLSEGAD